MADIDLAVEILNNSLEWAGDGNAIVDLDRRIATLQGQLLSMQAERVNVANRREQLRKAIDILKASQDA